MNCYACVYYHHVKENVSTKSRSNSSSNSSSKEEGEEKKQKKTQKIHSQRRAEFLCIDIHSISNSF